MDRRVELDVIGALESADKSSSYHLAWDYLRHYETFVADYRDDAINILEIGVFTGSSLRLWKWFFPNAQITGIDINPDCTRYAGERMHVAIGSQIDPAFLDEVCDRAPPTIIVDDGSHVDEHMIFSFEHLFPKLAPGGLYIVEDIVHRTRREQRLNATGKPQASTYFLDIGSACLAGGDASLHAAVPDWAARTVDRVSFIEGSVCLHKRDIVRDVARAMATADAYLHSQAATPPMHMNYAEWLCANNGPPARALAAADAAGATADATRLHLLRADALRRAGDLAAARAQIAGLPAAGIKQPPHLLRLAALQMALDDHAAAAETYRVAQERGMSNVIRRRWARLMETAAAP